MAFLTAEARARTASESVGDATSAVARKRAIAEMKTIGDEAFAYRDATGRDPWELMRTYEGYTIDDSRDMCALLLGIREIADNITMQQIRRFTESIRRALDETIKYNKDPIRPWGPAPDKWPAPGN